VLYVEASSNIGNFLESFGGLVAAATGGKALPFSALSSFSKLLFEISLMSNFLFAES
jgi:hypothetical protein